MADTRWAKIAALLLLPLAAACGDDPAGPPPNAVDDELATLVRQSAVPLTGAAQDYDPLLALTASARFVLLGEQTHGTHEFYRERARISRRLIEEQAFTAVAVEADWPEAERVNWYVRGQSADAGAQQALGDFTAFPRWMWANTDVRDFVEYLRQRNAAAAEPARVGFYGIDLQAMFESITAVLRYLDRVDPEAAQRARGRYACFDRFEGDPGRYGTQAQDPQLACDAEAAEQLQELEARYAAASTASPAALDSLFSALMNARAVKNGEAYYRASVRGGYTSWNLRDTHMAETLERIVAHGARLGRAVKIVVWAHNTHVGDDRGTEMGAAGQVNLGMLMRQRQPGAVVLVGFTTYAGTVVAASEWGRPGTRQTLQPARSDSYAGIFHRSSAGNFLLVLRGNAGLTEPFSQYRLQRAIGVVYRPDTERESHYFAAKLAVQFDAVVHLETTQGVAPL